MCCSCWRFLPVHSMTIFHFDFFLFLFTSPIFFIILSFFVFSLCYHLSLFPLRGLKTASTGNEKKKKRIKKCIKIGCVFVLSTKYMTAWIYAHFEYILYPEKRQKCGVLSHFTPSKMSHFDPAKRQKSQNSKRQKTNFAPLKISHFVQSPISPPWNVRNATFR